MKFKIKVKLSQFLILLNAISMNVLAQEIPLVYSVENRGAEFPEPPLPSVSELRIIDPLPDPFEWSDGSGRSTRFTDWYRRRAEIGAEIEHYEIGEKPTRPDSIEASYINDTLTVNITVNGNMLSLTSKISLPEGEGPYPAVIGIGRGTGSLPPDIFTNRDIAQITFNFAQVMSHTQKRGDEPINKLYPDLISMGAYSAWSWGVSRIIDGLELVSPDLKIDLEHLAVTGCSFAGKMALFAGAFDERIALTIAQESGGGGAAAWRVSETLGNVETLGATSHAWFTEDMFMFSGSSVSKLPYDHHELMAMVAPRALLVLGNPDYVWLADESGYVSCRATHEVWKTFGVPDRFGFSIAGGHRHCSLLDSQYPEVEAFVDKFLLGDKTANTKALRSPYDHVDHTRWIEWWGSGDPVFPERVKGEIYSIYLEAECGSIGEKWDILPDPEASNGDYIAVKPGIESLTEAATDTESLVSYPFTVNKDSTYYLFGLFDCATADDDSYWVKMDDGEFVMYNGKATKGWEWVRLSPYKLSQGEHTLTLTYREDGAKLDKICITDYAYAPADKGDKAINICEHGNSTGLKN